MSGNGKSRLGETAKEIHDQRMIREAIKLELLRRMWTQRELSKKANIRYQHVNAMLAGRVRISLDSVTKIGRALGFDMDASAMLKRLPKS